MRQKLRVLCLDIEGGYGGSSRSLFESITQIPKDQVEIEVWCKRGGPIQARYHAIGVPTRVTPFMPKITSLPRISRNLWMMGRFLSFDWPRSRSFRKQLLKISKEVDLIHFNHEGLYWLVRWLNRKSATPITLHKRTNPWPSIFARMQMGIIDRHTDQIIFITENEEDNYIKLGGRPNRGSVIYNIVQSDKNMPLPLKLIPDDDRFKLCTLANYSFLRGVDRLVGVAQSLAEKGNKEFLFVVAGNLTLTRSLPGKLGSVARKGGDLSDYASEMGVDGMFLFLGHIDKPEKVLSGCHALIRLSRWNNPWGRDVLEAFSFGRPVLATGTYDRFVEDGLTGFLFNDFDPNKVAERIIELANDRDRSDKMGLQGKKRVQKLCNGHDRAHDLLQLWKETVNSK